MHRYRSHTCGALRDSHIGETVRLSGWVHRVRDHGGVLFIDLRDHYGLTQVVADPDSAAFKDAEKLHAEWVVRIDGKVRKRPEGTTNPELPTGAGRGLHLGDRGAGPRRRTADAGVRRSGVSGGNPPQISLPRPAPRAAARQHHQARADHRLDPPPHEGAGLLRVPDADPDRVVAGRRARLPRAVAAASGQVLRAAAGAAAVQAAHDDRGLRPLLPDRAVLPRRGRARRPLARRVLSARRRDELRHAGRRVRRDRAGDARHVRGVRRRQAGDAEVSAHSVRRGAAQIRHRQAGPAQPDRDAERQRGVPRLGVQDLRQHSERRREERGLGHSGAGRRQSRVRGPHELVGAGRRASRALATSSGARARRAALARSPRTSARSAPSRSPISSGSASATRCSSSRAIRTSS